MNKNDLLEDQKRDNITRFGIIRHAQTEWNRDKRIQGQHDSPLTSEGRRCARLWGETLKWIPWGRIVSSDLGRTRQTAEQVNRSLNLSIEFDSRLREQDWGKWVGQTIQQIKHSDPDTLADQVAQGWYFRPPGGENRLQVWQRGYAFLQEAARKWPGEDILLVTHEGLMKCLIYRYLERRFVNQEPSVLRPAHLHWLRFRPDKIEIEQLNAIPLTNSTGEVDS